MGTLDSMSDQKQRTQWALEQFAGFVRAWTPTGALPQVLQARIPVENAIRAIAPQADDTRRVGWAVFKREHDTEYDRERPSGWVHTMISAVFENPVQADNACRSRRKRYPDQTFVICEIQEIP
jgi:hypothetical protein